MSTVPTVKTCSLCGKEKSAAEFYPRRRQCRPCYADLRRSLHAKRAATPEGKERIRGWKYVARYGITVEDYDALYQDQAGCCAICMEPHDRLHVDHDHETNRVRGLLCTRCNQGIGYFKDQPERLLAAAEYLSPVTVGGT